MCSLGPLGGAESPAPWFKTFSGSQSAQVDFTELEWYLAHYSSLCSVSHESSPLETVRLCRLVSTENKHSFTRTSLTQDDVLIYASHMQERPQL